MTLMQRRRALMGVKKGGGRLPAEYQEVEWISRDSIDPWLNMSFGNFGPLTMTVIVTPDGVFGQQNCFVGRSAWSTRTNDYFVGFSATDVVSVFSGDNVSIISTEKNENKFTVILAINVPSTTGRFCLFKMNSGKWTFKGKIYNVKLVKDGNTLVELIPCYRKSDGEIGMLDIVSNAFITNAGSGIFTKGGNV